MSEQDSDEQIIVEARAGHERSFEELVRRYMPVATAYALGYSRFPDDVDDIVQDVFLEVYTGLARLRDPSRFGAWLRRLVRNHAVNCYRKRKRLSEIATAFADRPINKSEQGIAAAEVEQMVLGSLAEIREKYRLVLYLHLITGLPAVEIAARTGLTVGNVRIRIMRGLDKLRKKLEGIGVDASALRP